MRIDQENNSFIQNEEPNDSAKPPVGRETDEGEPIEIHIERHDCLTGTWLLIFRNFIGMSSLSCVYYFQEVGIIWSIVVLIGSLVLCFYGNWLFCKVADTANFKKRRMEQLMGAYFGETGYYVCAFFVLVTQICIFVNTFMIYYEYLDTTFCDQLGWTWICLEKWQWFMVFFVIEAPLIFVVTQMNFFTYLAVPSMFGLMSVCNLVHG